jgi:hypothetical protein
MSLDWEYDAHLEDSAMIQRLLVVFAVMAGLWEGASFGIMVISIQSELNSWSPVYMYLYVSMYRS